MIRSTLIQSKRAIVLAALTLASVGAACIHPPASYEGSWEESSQEALIFHRDSREELVLKVAYKFSPKGELPASFGWVIPVPTRPDAYALADKDVFKEAWALLEMHRKFAASMVRSIKKPAEAEELPVKVVDQQVVGEFEITALEADGAKAPEALNKWLSKNGFKEIPAETLEFYTKLKWTFLAVKVDPSKGKDKVSESGQLNALRISFKSEEIVYPLKLSAGEGAFDVTAYVFTEKPLETPKWLDERGFVVTSVDSLLRRGSTKMMNKSLSSLGPDGLKKLGFDIEQGKMGRFEGVYLTTFKASAVNSKENKIADWKTDFVVREVSDDSK